MDVKLYPRTLQVGLLPFTSLKFPGGNFCFQQVNDLKHTSRVAKQFLEDNKINWWKTPAESSDLNPIERVWSHLKQFLTHTYKPKTRSYSMGLRSSGGPR